MSAMASLRADEHRLLAGYIYSLCGIQLDDTKGYLIESRLGNLMTATKSCSYIELYNKAKSDGSGALERSIIDAITTGETLFFRDGAPYELLRRKILPELIERRAAQWGSAKIPVRVWSAASSTGQELYSIAFVLREVLGGSDKYDIRLFGTDISVEAVERARLGIYNTVEAERGLPPAMLSRYFAKHGDGWKVRDEIRAMTMFRVMNLQRDFSYIGQYDIIFCRNVAIYFSEPDKATLFGRMQKVLAPDGYLLVGSTESLSGISSDFEPKRWERTVYYQRGRS